jgi:hypothetical protein
MRSERFIVWARCLVALGLTGWCFASPAGVLTDEKVKVNLTQGLEQKVIVQYRDSDVPAQESEGARRTRRKGLKDRVIGRLTSTHIRHRRDLSELPLSSVTLTQTDALQQLQDDPDVQFIFPDVLHKPTMMESLPLINQLPVASVMGRLGAGKAIAVLDTGVNYTRSEFGNCTAPGVPASTCRVTAALDAASDDGALDSIGHGTEVAMAALAVAPKASIVSVDVFNGNSAATSDILTGINWAIANRSTYNIGVINLSLGDGAEHASCGAENGFYRAIQSARSAGLIVVVSAGNEGYTAGISSPACVSAAVAVGAVYDANVGPLSWTLNRNNATTGATTSSTCTDNPTTADQITCFSDSSSLLDVLAPGALVTVGGTVVAGTSISAPMVSGAVAVLRSQFPSETITQIEARITGTGKLITDTRNHVARRRLDLLAAQGAPSNDAMAQATAISGSASSLDAWNYNATSEASEPAHAGITATRSVWFKWTAPETGTLNLNTQGSAIDTSLAVYTGTAVNALTLLTSDDDTGGSGTSLLAMPVTAGQAYLIAVDGKAGSVGAVRLNWSASNTPYLADVSVFIADPLANPLVVTISNQGPQVATQTVVTVNIPSQASVISAPASCSLANNAAGTVATCNVGALANGASVGLSFTLSQGLNAASATQASASVSSAVPDANAANNQATYEGGDAPLPAWALWALGAGLWWVRSRR